MAFCPMLNSTKHKQCKTKGTQMQFLPESKELGWVPQRWVEPSHVHCALEHNGDLHSVTIPLPQVMLQNEYKHL